MKRIQLTEDEKDDLESQHKLSVDSRECDRIKAVLLRSEGWTVPMISQALWLHQGTIIRHLNDYRNDKLTTNNGGSTGYLDDEQTIFLISHLTEKLYHHNHQIISFIKGKWSIIFTVPGLHKLLHRNG